PTNSKTRGFPALEIEPNALLPTTPFGSASGGVLVTLNASARSSKVKFSRIGNVLPIITSAFCNPGPRTGLRELVPIVNGPAALNIEVSKYFATLRPSKSFGLPVRFGRWTAKPKLELLLVNCVTGTASPACRRTSPANCKPEIFQNRGIS